MSQSKPVYPLRHLTPITVPAQGNRIILKVLPSL